MIDNSLVGSKYGKISWKTAGAAGRHQPLKFLSSHPRVPDDGRDRAVDGGRQEVQPLRPSRRDYDPDWLSPRRAKAFHALFGRIGARAKMQCPIHPHKIPHGCLHGLANPGHATRALQAWLGHKNIQHTVRYTELAPDRFKNFWR